MAYRRGIQFLDLWKLERFEVQLGVKMNFYGALCAFCSCCYLDFGRSRLYQDRNQLGYGNHFPPHLDCKETVVFWLWMIAILSKSLHCYYMPYFYVLEQRHFLLSRQKSLWDVYLKSQCLFNDSDVPWIDVTYSLFDLRLIWKMVPIINLIIGAQVSLHRDKNNRKECYHNFAFFWIASFSGVFQFA